MVAEPSSLADVYREAYERGDKQALLQTIKISIMLHQPLPEWAAKAFEAAYDHVMTGGAASWDDVFGRPHPKGRHLDSIQQDQRAYEIYGRVLGARQSEKIGISDELFDIVGEQTGLGARIVKRLYYSVQKQQDEVRASRQRDLPKN